MGVLRKNIYDSYGKCVGFMLADIDKEKTDIILNRDAKGVFIFALDTEAFNDAHKRYERDTENALLKYAAKTCDIDRYKKFCADGRKSNQFLNTDLFRKIWKMFKQEFFKKVYGGKDNIQTVVNGEEIFTQESQDNFTPTDYQPILKPSPIAQKIILQNFSKIEQRVVAVGGPLCNNPNPANDPLLLQKALQIKMEQDEKAKRLEQTEKQNLKINRDNVTISDNNGLLHMK